MLNTNDLSILYNLISDENKTFEGIIQSFQKSFLKADQFKVGVTLWFLLKDNLLNLCQRLGSLYILYEMYRSEKASTTPFISVILEVVQTSKNNVEKKLIVEFIDVSSKLPKTTIKAFIDENKNIDNVVVPDLKQYWNISGKEKEKLTSQINDWIRPVIYDRDPAFKQKIENMPPFNLASLSPEEISLNHFEPDYLTYYPNATYPFYDDEPLWIMPTMKYDFLWDFTMTPEQDTVLSLLNKIINNTSNSNLNEEQTRYILDKITENPNILSEIEFTPECLMKLIEKNTKLATDIFHRISKNQCFQEYLSPFISQPWTVNSMDVLNKIIQKVELPNEFIFSYIKHCINNYKQETDKILKIRLARIIAIFITNLIEYEHLVLDRIPLEIEEFCIENKKLDEINKLYSKFNMANVSEHKKKNF